MRFANELLPTPDVDQPIFDLTDQWSGAVEDGADIQNRELPSVVEVVKGIVTERSKLSIVSGAKSFKTWLTIHLALAISHGRLFLDRPTVQSRVLYVNLELKADTFDRRVQAVAKEMGLTLAPGWFRHLALRGKLAGLGISHVISNLIGVVDRTQSKVIVIDPLFKLNTEGDENSSRDQTVFLNQLDRLTTEAQCTVIFNDHSGKGGQADKEPLDVIRGSSAKAGDLDAAMVLRRHEQEVCFRVDLVHRELPPVAPFVIRWDFPLMRMEDALDAEAMRKPGRQPKHDERVLLRGGLCTSPENPISSAQWARNAGVARTTLTEYFNRWRSRGFVLTVSEGSKARQYLTTEGHAYANTSR
jgi:hypothetical protein